jgi:hypothetical protein
MQKFSSQGDQIMFKQIRILFIVVVVGLAGALPMFAKEPFVDYRYDGIELHKLEDGVVVQTWTLPNTLDTQQTVAALRARAQTDDPDVRFVFDHDRMYHILHNQVIGLWALRGGEWVDVPALVVQYVYDGQELQRLVNGELQQAWTLPNGLETHQLMTAMQAEADQLANEGIVVETNPGS